MNFEQARYNMGRTARSAPGRCWTLACSTITLMSVRREEFVPEAYKAWPCPRRRSPGPRRQHLLVRSSGKISRPSRVKRSIKVLGGKVRLRLLCRLLAAKADSGPYG